MPAFQGQTDQVLRIQVTSYLLVARWLEEQVALNGEAGVEIITAYVGEGAKVNITVKDGEGKAAGSLDGKVLSNQFRARFPITSAPAGGRLTFEAELPAHGLKLASGELLIGPPLIIDALVWQNPNGQGLTEAMTGDQAVLKAKIKGKHSGRARVMICCRQKEDPNHSPSPSNQAGHSHHAGPDSEHGAGVYDLPIANDGGLELHCHLNHANHPAGRRDNILRFKVLCDGFASAWSPDLPYTASPEFKYSR